MDRQNTGAELRDLAIAEPFLSAILAGLKVYETRDYPPRHRGTVLLSTVKTPWPFDRQPGDPAGNLPGGYAYAVADITGCVECSAEFRVTLSENELRWGFYHDGRYAWRLEHVRLLPAPVPVRNYPGALFPVGRQIWRLLDNPNTDPALLPVLHELSNLEQLPNLEQEV